MQLATVTCKHNIQRWFLPLFKAKSKMKVGFKMKIKINLIEFCIFLVLGHSI